MLETFDLTKYNEALSRGLCKGKGNQDSQMCIEAAVCYAFGLPHSDNPKCVSEAVRQFKIRLNDHEWSSPKARSEGLRDLGLAQLGSLGVIDDEIFAKKLTLKIINTLLPTLWEEAYPTDQVFVDDRSLLASKFRKITNLDDALHDLLLALDEYHHSDFNVFRTIRCVHTSWLCLREVPSAIDAIKAAANAASYATYYDYIQPHKQLDPDKYLKLAANIALNVLKELNSPGCQFLTR